MSYHEPVLFRESINGLNIDPSGIYIDATFGGGGHSLGILEKLRDGKLIAFDQDEDAKQNIPGDNRFLFIQGNFRFLTNYLRYYGFRHVDGILADLGVSSYHLDQPRRGFSYRFDSALDMRMNPGALLDADKIINEYTQKNLSRVFREYGELNNANRLAETIVALRTGRKIHNTNQLVDVLSPCIPRSRENQYLSKVFQALRIEVNHEIKNLKELLMQSTPLLNANGRLVIISYHSLEDRLVKNFMRSGNFTGELVKDIYGNITAPLTPVNRRPIIPGENEIRVNNRARSAKLRIAEKTRS